MNRILVKRLALVLAAALALTASATSEDRWRTIGPGGGGALFHPTISPHDPRTVLVACDMTGSYITTDAGGHWHVFNLGLQVQFLLLDPIDPGVIYAKAGALFRSADGGTTWARFFPSTLTRVTMGEDHALSGGGERYDDQYESPGGTFEHGGQVVTTPPLPTPLHAMPEIVSAERQCEEQHFAITRGVKDRCGGGRRCAIQILTLSRLQIPTDLRGPSGATEQAHIAVFGVAM